MSTTIMKYENGELESVENEFYFIKFGKNLGNPYGEIILKAKDTDNTFNGDIELFMGTEDGLLIKQDGNLLMNVRNDGVNVSVPLFTSQGNVPTTSTSTGQAGEEAWDSNYLYKCIATNTWVRSDLNTW